MARVVGIIFCLGDDLIDPLLRVRLAQTGLGRDQLHNIGLITRRRARATVLRLWKSDLRTGAATRNDSQAKAQCRNSNAGIDRAANRVADYAA